METSATIVYFPYFGAPQRRGNLQSYSRWRIYSRKKRVGGFERNGGTKKEEDFNDVGNSVQSRSRKEKRASRIKCYTSVAIANFTNAMPDSAPLRSHSLKPRCKISFLARTCNVPISIRKCNLAQIQQRPALSPLVLFLFDATASSDVVRPAFLHISQSPAPTPSAGATFPQCAHPRGFFYPTVRARDQPAFKPRS